MVVPLCVVCCVLCAFPVVLWYIYVSVSVSVMSSLYVVEEEAGKGRRESEIVMQQPKGRVFDKINPANEKAQFPLRESMSL